MAKSNRNKPEHYLKLPYRILNIGDLGMHEKVLLCHIYSFGAKGCWQSNKTLAEMFGVSAGTVSRWIARLGKHISIKNPKGYYRTIWAKSHPDVRQAIEQFHSSRKRPIEDSGRLRRSAQHPAQKCISDLRKSAIRLTQKCATTNNTTKKETTGETTATPSPLPAGGQAPALLADRSAEAAAQIERFKRTAGLGRLGRWKLLDEGEFQDRRRRQIAALKALRVPGQDDERPPPGRKPNQATWP